MSAVLKRLYWLVPIVRGLPRDQRADMKELLELASIAMLDELDTRFALADLRDCAFALEELDPLPPRSPYIALQPKPICDPDRMRDDKQGEQMWDEVP